MKRRAAKELFIEGHMDNSAYLTLTCKSCGKYFVLDLPVYCPKCSSEGMTRSQNLFCYRCRAELNIKKPIYCANCYTVAETDFRQSANDCQKRTDELQAKLLTIESQKSKLEALLRQKEELTAELRQKVALIESGEYSG